MAIDRKLNEAWDGFAHANRSVLSALSDEGQTLVRWAFIRGAHHGSIWSLETMKDFEDELFALSMKLRPNQ